MSERKIVDFYQAGPEQVVKLMSDYSEVSEMDKFWIDNYNKDHSHGIAHGREVSDFVLLLVKNLTREEKGKLRNEGRLIRNPCLETAIAVAQIGAYLHDCGRFATRYSFNSGGDGLWKIELQNMHPDFGAERAASVIYASGLIGAKESVPFLRDGIASHEFQSERLTPQYRPSISMIGKLIHSADQLRWFKSGSISTTERYNDAKGIPLFRGDIPMDERLSWVSNTPSRDALTVMLAQVYGPTGNGRFGTEYSQELAKSLKIKIKDELIQLCEERGIVNKALEIIRKYEKVVADLD